MRLEMKPDNALMGSGLLALIGCAGQAFPELGELTQYIGMTGAVFYQDIFDRTPKLSIPKLSIKNLFYGEKQ
ncbi:MAG: hypothetical protein QT05_C0013G0020 [archaeon GW2011_AR13]|nr:MAG: hypothetical protein QT05_C0013G0020 [archaeon GW2011_AR13]HIG94981.1 hypothetical protein [Nanoarchaeota archaeon]HIH62907.1 hypothetical protein [Nanoarchaeota archaeon]HIJ10324.1 hypothetical protein [Nanoarchaeota archaeon]